MDENMSFEAAMKRLNEVVELLEKGTAPLDEALTYFEEGIRLVKFCNDKLEHAEQQIKILKRGDDGLIEEAEFSTAPTAD